MPLHDTCDNQIGGVVWIFFLTKGQLQRFRRVEWDDLTPYHQASIDLYCLEVGSRDRVLVNVFKL